MIWGKLWVAVIFISIQRQWKTTKEIMAIFVVNEADKVISKYLATTTTHFYTHT